MGGVGPAHLLLGLQQKVELRSDPDLALDIPQSSALSVGLNQLHQQSPLRRVGGHREGRGGQGARGSCSAGRLSSRRGSPH